VSIRSVADRPAPLPILVRPQQGESVESYIRRLARANYLRPSYLHGYLCGPPYYRGTVQPERLAIVSGRALNALTHVFPSLAATNARRGAQPPIRRASTEGLSVRALAARYRVHRRTVTQALTNAAPPPRKQHPPRGTRLDHLHAHIDKLISAEPNVSAQRIWERLTDEHDAEVSCSTVRNYLSGRNHDRRRENNDPGQID
jgi:hypothetical protein